MKMRYLLGLEQIYNILSDQILPISISYKLSSLIYSYENDLNFYHKQLDKIVEAYGEKDENGKLINTENSVLIQPAAIASVSETIKQLDEIEVHEPDIFLDTNDISQLESLKLTPRQILNIVPFIKEKPQT